MTLLALQWDTPCNENHHCWTAKTFYGIYYISYEEDEYYYGMDNNDLTGFEGDSLEFSEAKQKCTEHYETLIRSAFCSATRFQIVEEGVRPGDLSLISFGVGTGKSVFWDS